MIRSINCDPVFLSIPSLDATKADLPLVLDLVDTLKFHRDHCVGMAANMIGFNKRVIAVLDQHDYLVMLNPQIMQHSGVVQVTEGCLSLKGTKITKRYLKIKVRYQNEAMQIRIKTYTGWTAQIIQHEIDHCQGILI